MADKDSALIFYPYGTIACPYPHLVESYDGSRIVRTNPD